MPSVVVLSVEMLNVLMLSVLIITWVVRPSAFILNAIMLIVVAPPNGFEWKEPILFKVDRKSDSLKM